METLYFPSFQRDLLMLTAFEFPDYTLRFFAASSFIMEQKYLGAVSKR